VACKNIQGTRRYIPHGEQVMPAGKGTYGKKRGRPAKKGKGTKKKSTGLTAAQKKLPKALQMAIMRKKRKGKKK